MKKLIITLILSIAILTGCSKDGLIDRYKNISEKIGDVILTNDCKLKGIRTFGLDHYVGIYEVEYKDYTGKEVVFGGTTIKKDNDDNIHVKIMIKDSKGSVQVIQKLKEEDRILASKDGIYGYDFNINDGSNYLIINLKDYSGKIKIDVDYIEIVKNF
ncbi:MAG: hypothetical protein J6J17_04355 [Bacilli bacterium]|nr:hypothetical protein [Bacilli bacterium]